MGNEELIPTTVQPAHIKFYCWKPFLVQIDERQRHLAITGSYAEGQKRYLSNIISQDIAHIRYTEKYGHLVKRYEHSQMINGMIIFASSNSSLRDIVEKGIRKNNNCKYNLIMSPSERNGNNGSLLEEVKQLNLDKEIEGGGILYLEFDPNYEEESTKAINYIMKQLTEIIPYRKSLFVYSIVFEDVDMLLHLNKEFEMYFRYISQDRRTNRCAMSVNYENKYSQDSPFFRGFKNHISIEYGNQATAELTKCGKIDSFSFMPFAPVEPI
jgi:hypothetical protein